MKPARSAENRLLSKSLAYFREGVLFETTLYFPVFRGVHEFFGDGVKQVCALSSVIVRRSRLRCIGVCGAFCLAEP